MQINAMNTETNLDCFKVFVRIRPLSEKENNSLEKMLSNTKIKRYPKSILVREDNLLFVLDPDSLEYNGRKERNFVFDDIYEENHSNSYIFENVIKNNIDNVLKGFNSTALAYGVTGTGKTHTIFGDMRKYVENFDYYSNKESANKDNNVENSLNPNEEIVLENPLVKFQDNFNLQKFLEEANLNGKKFELGVCVHAVDYLFNQVANSNSKVFKIKISYLEIYNEQVIDLLVEKSPPLMIVEDAQKGVLVPDLTEFDVNNSSELIKLIIEGNQRRTMAATGQNLFSSRSHAILQILVEQRSKVKDIKEEYLVSKFLLVDLAGSERGGLEKGIRTHEGKNINKSLLSLGNCINILSDKSKKGAFVPYRDSKLTRLLKDSLGGNIMTVMIACVSPAAISYDETVNTLKYAMRARKIEKKITKNVKEVDVHISQYRDIIDSLKSEIEQLKQIIKEQQMKIHKGNVNIDEHYNPKDNEEYNPLHHQIQISKSNDKLNYRLNGNSKERENNNLSKRNSRILRENSQDSKVRRSNVNSNRTLQEELKSPYRKDEKDFLSMRKSTESLDLLKKREPKDIMSDDQVNIKSKIEYKENIKDNVSAGKKDFSSNKNLKSSKQIENKNNARDLSLYSSAGQSQKMTYENIYKKRTHTQKYLNESRIRNNINKRVMSENQENTNNISSPNSINFKDFDLNGYKSFLNRSGDDDFNIEELEKHVENLNNDKIFIEELLEKESKSNSTIVEKYKTIKSCYEKYLHYINEKLIQNIEESMILKFNLKEILDLNLTNQNNINTLTNQINNLEKLTGEKNGENIQSIEEEITKLKEEMDNVNNAIVENDSLKEKIGDSLKKNLRFKDFLKKILLKLISKSQKKETNLEEAYIKIIKEKEELEKKNKTYEKHLTTILKEKHVKESKLDKVEDELNKLKKIIAEKDKQLKNMQTISNYDKNKYKNNYSKNKISQSRGRDFSNNNSKKVFSSISLEKNYAKNKVIKKEETKTQKILNPQIKNIGKTENILINNLTNSTNIVYDENLTEQDRIEINLQDEYVGTKKKFINELNHVPVKNSDLNNGGKNIFVKETLNTNSVNNIAADKDDIKIEIDLQNLIYNKNSSINNQASIQNIKYIINQTNNIVNNNINKIIEKDNNTKKPTNNKSSYNSLNKFSSINHNQKPSLNVRESYKEKIKEAMNLNSKDLANPKKNRMNSLQKSSKRNSIVSDNVMDFYEEKILKTNIIDAYNDKDFIKNKELYKINLNSPKKKLIDEKLNTQANVSKGKNSKKFKEYDKIIENQLNEVYNKKAKEIGEKIKRNIKNANYSKNNASKRNSLQTSENNVQILSELNQFYNKNDSINKKELTDKPNLNRSLSISCVSVNQENGFCSELDIVDQINDKELIINDESANRNKIFVKKLRQDSNAIINSKYNKRYKKISIIKANNKNQNVNIGQTSKNNDQSNKQCLEDAKKEDHIIQDSEFNINQENVIKVISLKDDIKRKSPVNEGLNAIEPISSNKKPNFNINPSPIKIDNNFVNNFINAKKIKPIDFTSSTEFKKNAERYINLPKNVDKNNNNNIEQDMKKDDTFNYDLNKKEKEDEQEINEISEGQIPNKDLKNYINYKDFSNKNSDEKTKKGIMNLIPFNKNISNSDISQKKVVGKFNSSKSIHSNTLLNSAEIKEDILLNVTNLNSNRNKQNKNNNLNSNNYQPDPISVPSRVLSNVNVQKFINSPNNYNKNLNTPQENSNPNQTKNDSNLIYLHKDIFQNPSEIIKDISNKKNGPDLKKYISEREINTFLNEFDLIRNKANKNEVNLIEIEKNPNLNLSKDKTDFNNNRIGRERSSSILKKARMERKIIKNNDAFELDSPDAKIEKNQQHNKSNIINYGNENPNLSSNKINNDCSRYSSTNKKNKSSVSKNNTTTSDKNLNNFNYLKNNFNSYKSKKLENNMVRKGSNISKHSVDFVNEYINQKKNKIPINNDNKKDEVEKITVKRDFNPIFYSDEKANEDAKNLISLKNCDLENENIGIYNDLETQEIKAVFIQNKKDSKDDQELIPNYEKIQVKKYITSNILNNNFTSKFLSNEN